jgi:hypothetical protein
VLLLFLFIACEKFHNLNVAITVMKAKPRQPKLTGSTETKATYPALEKLTASVLCATKSA